MSNEPANPTGPTAGDSASVDALSEATVQAVANRFRDAYDARNVDAFVELFAERGDWTLGAGTFVGKAAIRRVLEWDVRFSPTASSRPLGITSVVSGNVAVNERLLEQSAEGIPYTCPAVTVLELNEAGEIEHARSYYDRLAIFGQVASTYPGIKGWLFRRIINFMIGQAEKGVERS